jgi:hypothetical protein
MPTFMSRGTFDNLAAARLRFEQSSGTKTSNVFVPWAGEQLISRSRGIYYVGISAKAEEMQGEQSYEARLEVTRRFCQRDNIREHLGSPFWRFLNELTLRIFHRRCDESQELWGWSNLLKIAPEKHDQWPRPFVEFQHGSNVVALQEEIAPLRQSLIVIASEKDFGLLDELVPKGIEWDKTDRPGQTWRLFVPETGNLFIHSYHPGNLNRRNHFNDAVEEIVASAEDKLSRFEP